MYHGHIANIAERNSWHAILSTAFFCAWHCVNTDNCCFYLSSWLVFICFCDMLFFSLLSVGWSFVCASPMCIKIYCKRTQGSWLTICLTRPKLIDKTEQRETQRIFDDQMRFDGKSLSTSLNVYMWKCQKEAKTPKGIQINGSHTAQYLPSEKKEKSQQWQRRWYYWFFSLTLSTPGRLLSYANLL